MPPRWEIGLEHSTESRVLVMGILNVTPDSFSDGGLYLNKDKALAHARTMIEAGADIIDIGGESTRPFANPVPLDMEKRRVIPVIKALSREYDVPISIDTYKPQVAEEAIAAGATIVNDIFGLRKEGMGDVISRFGVGCVIMHMKGTPKDMQLSPHYDDVIGEIYDFLAARVRFAHDIGIRNEKIAIDPGIGFGKTVENNYEILRRLGELKDIGCPILIGPSRKSFIGAVTGERIPEKRLYGTIAAVVISVLNGARVVRVHDVHEIKQALAIVETVMTM